MSAASNWAKAPASCPNPALGVIICWSNEHQHKPRRNTYEFLDEVDLPKIEEVDAPAAANALAMGAAEGGETPSFFELVGAGRTQLGSSRPLTVSLVAVLLVALGVIHAAGALGSLSLGLAQNGLGRAMVAGALALAIGVGETVCAVQVRRGRAWARFAAACLAALMLLWLTMAPWSPGALTVVVFAAWLAVGALLVHPLTSRFFAAVQPAARQV